MKLFDLLAVGQGFDPDTSEATLPDHCMQVPRFLLTPCQTQVLGYETETPNRVLRYFVLEEGFSSSSFARVSIGDENGSKLFGHDLSLALVEGFERSLIGGIQVNGRLYVFLAYSSSQLKECSVWMTHLEGRWSVPSMRQKLGDFSRCTSASKYAARIGQCFSTTYLAKAADWEGRPTDAQVRHATVADIPAGGYLSNSKVHSDGTGLISRELLNDLLPQVQFALETLLMLPSFRLGSEEQKGRLPRGTMKH
jgi:RNA-dependent RNA polymerase